MTAHVTYLPARRRQRLDELTAARDRLNQQIRQLQPRPRWAYPIPTLVAEVTDWATQAALNQAELTHRLTTDNTRHITHPRPQT